MRLEVRTYLHRKIIFFTKIFCFLISATSLGIVSSFSSSMDKISVFSSGRRVSIFPQLNLFSSILSSKKPISKSFNISMLSSGIFIYLFLYLFEYILS